MGNTAIQKFWKKNWDKGGRKRKNHLRTLLGTYIKGDMVKSQKLAIFCDFNPVNLKIAKNDIAYPVANFARNLKILIFFSKKLILTSL